jgi:NAD(P)-dependent dehydrogenase (short-subunit alcohol dehydrogenase family)
MSALVPFDNANDYRKTSLKRVEGKDMTGKVVVVTGASGALGKEIMLALSSVGATVVAAGRSIDKLEKAKNIVIERNGGATKGTIEPLALDLSDYDSVETFVKDLKAKHPKIDVLINNAGMIPGQSFKESKYGTETTFQANFVSTVVLTEMMLPLMNEESGRIIHVSSLSHADAKNPIDWTAIPSTAESFGGYNKDYCESKWLLTAYSASLAARLNKSGVSKVKSVCADPGISPDSAMWDEQTFIMRFLARYVFKILTKTSPQAAGCATELAVTDELEGGGYYHSGNLYPAMRKDCLDPEQWKQMVKVLKKVLPEKLEKYAVDVE